MSNNNNNNNNCLEEPWGRYSASGGVYTVNGTKYLYSFGGDTLSDADGRGGGVVRTVFRFSLTTACWERLANSPVEIGYRATATQLATTMDPNNSGVYVFGGADRNRIATNHLWKYSLSQDRWTQVVLPGTNSSVPAARWKHAAVAISDTQILVTGGRGVGSTVYGDAWIFDAMEESWRQVGNVLEPVYRHGMAYDLKRNIAWIYGGLDASLARYTSQLWSLDLTSFDLAQASVDLASGDALPARLASHAMEYVTEQDVLIMWGGTCSDDSELYVYDIMTNTWCRIFPANRPEKRDAMLWSLQYPLFYIAQGDIICYNGQVLSIADVHVLNLQNLDEWRILYEPFNTRGDGNEPYCDGTNAGNCQPNPFLGDASQRASTCNASLLDRLFHNYSFRQQEPTVSPTVLSVLPSSGASVSSEGRCSLLPLWVAVLWIIWQHI